MSFWDKVSPVYDILQVVNRRSFRAMAEGVRQVVPEGAKVLECAAGTGILTAAAAEKAESVVCTDLSLPMLEKARKKCADMGFDNVSFEERDIYNMPDKDETYDAVVAGNVLHLLDEPERAVKELARVTKKGGKLILPTFLNADKDFSTSLLKIYRIFGFRSKEYTFDEFRAMLERCNAGRMKITRINGFMPAAFVVIRKG